MLSPQKEEGWGLLGQVGICPEAALREVQAERALREGNPQVGLTVGIVQCAYATKDSRMCAS